MTVKEKIKLYLKSQGISKKEFYRTVKLSEGFLDTGFDIGVERVKVILQHYPDISVRWLLLDDGEMLEADGAPEESSDISCMKEIIRNQAAALDRLTAQLNALDPSQK